MANQSQALFIQKQDCTHHLVLRTGRNMPVDSKVCQKSFNLTMTKITRMAFIVKQNKALYPCKIRVLRTISVMVTTHNLSHLIEQTRLGVNHIASLACPVSIAITKFSTHIVQLRHCFNWRISANCFIGHFCPFYRGHFGPLFQSYSSELANTIVCRN